jgi:hypothetical protein
MIFTRIYDSYFQSLSDVAEKNLPPDKALAEIIRRHALNVMERREWTAIYFREEAELDERQRRQVTKKKRQYDALIEEIYESGVKEGLFRDIPAHVAVSGILGMCNWLYVWYSQQGSMSAATIADHYASLLANGYARQPAALASAAE